MTNGRDAYREEVYDYVSKLNSLNQSQKTKVRELIFKYEEVFSNEPGCTNVYRHSIKLTREKAVVKKSYPVAFSQRGAVSKKI